MTEEFWFDCQQTSSGSHPASRNVWIGNTFPGGKATRPCSWLLTFISCGG